MIISVNWLKKFTNIDMPVDELATLIGARLVEIEEVIDLGQKYQGVVVARVVECASLEGSDHLNVTKIDDGGVTSDVERDENGLVQVVCGAPNVRAGILVAWLPPRSTVPETFNDSEPFVLGARTLRGVMSNGMLASAKELALGDSHDGIAEIAIEGAQPGDSFAAVYELDDYLLDIENKSLTHRPDTFGIIGFAREVAAIQGNQFVSPDWLYQGKDSITLGSASIEPPIVVIDDPNVSDRYTGIVLAKDETTSSSNQLSLMATLLARSGVRPISPIVDVTNYVMLLSGQPLHAFDYDKLVAVSGEETPTIHVRTGHEGETLGLLDGRQIAPTTEDIVIAAGDKAVALGGAMGGAETEIDETTTRVFLECATFNLYLLRNVQMRHGIFSEAITRLTKGRSAAQLEPVLAETVQLMAQLGGLHPISPVAEAYPQRHDPQPLVVPVQTINATLGATLPTEDIAQTLERAEFDVTIQDGALHITSPYWRSDIHITEDIIEEVGRLNGFDSINATLPQRSFVAVRPSTFDELRTKMRKILVRAGVNEVLTYSFVHGDVLIKAGQDPADSYRVTNSISPDLQYYRQSISPSLLGLVHPNSKAGYDSFALFEMNKTHTKQGTLVDGVPPELHRLGLVVANKKPQPGAPYYQAKKFVEYLGESLGLNLAYKTFPSETELIFTKPFELRRSARIVDVTSNQSIGIVGEYKKSVAKQFKLPEYVAGFELLPEAIALALEHKKAEYRPLSKYPSTERDICFQVKTDIAYTQIIDEVHDVLVEQPLQTSVRPIDIYQPTNGATKNITIRLRLTANDRTLESAFVQSIIELVVQRVSATLGATVI